MSRAEREDIKKEGMSATKKNESAEGSCLGGLSGADSLYLSLEDEEDGKNRLYGES